jgi:pimeloyl-ACP methyl ester carboxylesterase
MSKLLLVLALAMPFASLVLAKRATDDMPSYVEVGGHQLRTRIEGTGSPAVVMEIGLGGPLEEWAVVQSEVARFTCAFAYDRIGANYNVPVLTGRQIAADLHAALIKSRVPPPYVLVGQSFAGVYNQVFAQVYPDEVAGMVVLDSPTREFLDWIRANYPEEDITLKHHPDWPEGVGILPTFDELLSGGPLPNVPTVVVTAARPLHEETGFKAELRPVWIAAHEELAKQLPQGRHVITEKSGHGIQVEQPELVVELIRDLVEQARREGRDSVKRGSAKCDSAKRSGE